MPARFAEQLLADAGCDQGCNERVIHKPVSRAMRFARTKFPRGCGNKTLSRREFIHESNLERLFRRERFAGEDDVQRLGQTDQTRKAR